MSYGFREGEAVSEAALESALSAYLDDDARLVGAQRSHAAAELCRTLEPLRCETALILRTIEAVSIQIREGSKIHVIAASPIIIPKGAWISCDGDVEHREGGFDLPHGGILRVNECKFPAHFRVDSRDEATWLVLTLPAGTILRKFGR